MRTRALLAGLGIAGSAFADGPPPPAQALEFNPPPTNAPSMPRNLDFEDDLDVTVAALQ